MIDSRDMPVCCNGENGRAGTHGLHVGLLGLALPPLPPPPHLRRVHLGCGSPALALAFAPSRFTIDTCSKAETWKHA